MIESGDARKYGDCYEASFFAAAELEAVTRLQPEKGDLDSIRIVHGRITPIEGLDSGRVIQHSWVEIDDLVIEVSNGQTLPFLRTSYYSELSVAVDEYYTIREAQAYVKSLGGYGRWREREATCQDKR